MKRMIVFLLLILMLGGCSAAPAAPAPELLEPVDAVPDLEAAAKADLFDAVVYEAEVVPRTEELTFCVDGILEPYPVRLGDPVKQGQTLALLNTDTLQNRIQAEENAVWTLQQTGSLEEQVLLLDLEIARLELENAEEADRPALQTQTEILETRLEKARQLQEMDVYHRLGLLEELYDRQEDMQVTAPCDGEVVYLAPVIPGSRFGAYRTAVVVAREDESYLSAAWIPETELNQAVRIYAQIRDRQIPLKVLPYEDSEYLSAVLSGQEVRTRFIPEDPETELEVGSYAAVVLVKVEKENVLSVPTNTLYQDGSSWYVTCLRSGQPVRCDVTPGISTPARTEIRKGLQEGDMVYVKN